MRLTTHLARAGIDILSVAHDGKPGGLAARIELQAQRLGCTAHAIFQAEGERMQPHHHRPTSCQQQPRPLLRAGHQRLLLLVQDKHGHVVLQNRRPYGPGDGRLAASLPSGMYTTGSCPRAATGTFGALPFASMIPTFQGPGLRKHPGVGLDDL